MTHRPTAAQLTADAGPGTRTTATRFHGSDPLPVRTTSPDSVAVVTEVPATADDPATGQEMAVKEAPWTARPVRSTRTRRQWWSG